MILFYIDMGTLVAEGVDYDNEQIVSDDDDNHFLGVNHQDLKASGIHMEEEDKPCITTSTVGEAIPQQEVPCKKEDVEAEAIKQASKTVGRSGIDYKGIWMNNNMPCVVAQINSGKLLKGNSFFMK